MDELGQTTLQMRNTDAHMTGTCNKNPFTYLIQQYYLSDFVSSFIRCNKLWNQNSEPGSSLKKCIFTLLKGQTSIKVAVMTVKNILMR